NRVVETLERGALAAPSDELARDAGVLSGLSGQWWKAGVVLLLVFVQPNGVAHAPRPVPAQPFLDHLGLAAERDLGGAHLRRHDADEIVGAENVVEEFDQGFLDVM